jgi:alkylation response protein AidB-like acyl-CoA dehydrogenase
MIKRSGPCRTRRRLRGGLALAAVAAGIVADYNLARFFADAEALYSYEGTYQMQNLIVGKAITGHGAFV